MGNQVNLGITAIQSKIESGRKSIGSSMEISKVENEIQRLLNLKVARMFEIGSIIHKTIRDGSRIIPDEAFNPYNAVFAIDVQIKEMRDQIHKIRNSLNKEGIPCHSCGKPTPITAKFCVHCGTPAIDESNSPKCISCSGSISVTDAYCSHCGNKVR